MDLREKLLVIERKLGGPGKAAEACGVTLTSWGRWKNPRGITPTGPRLKLIERLYEDAVQDRDTAKAANGGEERHKLNILHSITSPIDAKLKR